MRRLSLLTLLALLLCSVVFGAQTAAQTAARPAAPAQATPPVPANAVKLKGRVVDPSGGVMVGADVQVFLDGKPPRLVATGKTDAQGDFELNVAPGPYQLKISVPGGDFKEINQTVRVTADMAPLSYTMTIGVDTEIVVNSVSNDIGVDPDSSLNTDVITGDALLDLPDNEDDLLAYLTQLAQIRGGDGEVTLSVDGFTGGNLPPLAQIAEIRIVNSSFSADGSTGPRIEIVTKAGSGKWTAQTQFTFNDESLNALNHLSTGKRPKSQTRNLSVNSSGPIIPGRLSLNANIAHNETDSGGADLRAFTPFGFSSGGVTSINGGRNYLLSPRLMINKNNNLTTSFTYQSRNVTNNGVGGLTLPERVSNNKNSNWQVQISDRITKGKVVDTIRFQDQHNTTHNTPVALNPATAVAYLNNPNLNVPYTVNVTGAFQGGLAPNNTNSVSENYLFGNTMQWQPKPKLTFSALAFELQYHRSDSNNRNNYNGTFNFPSLYDYCGNLAADFSVGPQCQVELQNRLAAKAAYDSDPANIEAGRTLDITPKVPTQFTQSTGDAQIKVAQMEFAVWGQGDWRMTPRADISFGLRYQVQQHFSDYNNLAPVAGISYQLRTKGNWKTVVRTGVKMTDSVFSMSTYQQLQQSGFNSAQKTLTLLNPGYPDPFLGGIVNNSTSSVISTRILAADAVQPYQMNPSFTWEQSMPRGMTISATYNLTRGYRQNRNVNINAPWPGTDLPDDLRAELNSLDPTIKANARAIVDAMRPYYPTSTGNITEIESVGKSITHAVNVNYRLQNYSLFNNKFRVSGNLSYGYTFGKDDSQFENPYDRLADYARINSSGSRINGTINVNAPKRITISMQTLGWQTGRPYSWTTGSDTNGDSSNTDRPDGQFRNEHIGPSYISLPQLRVSKIFVLTTPKTSTAPSLGRLVSSFAEPVEPAAEPAQGGGGGGGGGGFGGGGGGFGGGGGNRTNPNRVPTGARTVTFNIQATNVFNSSVRTNINGIIGSPLFLQTTGGSPGRKITLSMQMKLF